MKVLLKILMLITLSLQFCCLAKAEVREESGRFGGLDLRYRVILPDNYDPERSYPTILHFAGGSQSWDIVVRSTDSDWRERAERDGYIIISPASPNGELFFQGASRIFPEFLSYILDNYPVAGGKLHVTGHSNGGLSAFAFAASYPDSVISLTGYPGMLANADNTLLEGLRPLCIFMHVGDRDTSWRSAMRAQYQALQARGYHISYRVETDQIHRLDVSKDNLDSRLFSELEQARNGCAQ